MGHVETTGIVKVEYQRTKYRARVHIQFDKAVTNKGYTSLDQLKKDFFVKAMEEGLNVDAVTEDHIDYTPDSQGGMAPEDIVLHFDTPFRDQIRTLFRLKAPGIQVKKREVLYVVDMEAYALLIMKAMEDAKRKATVIAKQMKKRLGSIINVEKKAMLFEYWGPHNAKTNHFFLGVSYEVN